MEILCPGENPYFLIFDFSTRPSLLFYTYIPVIIISVFLGVLVLIKDRANLASRLLFWITISFSLWVLDIFVLWVASYNDALMFGWQITPVFELALFIFSIYFTYVITDKENRDAPEIVKIVFLLIMAGVFFFLPTHYNIYSYDLVSCEGLLGGFWDIMYALEFVFIAWIVGICVYRYRKLPLGDPMKQEISYFGTGIFSFLVLFNGSNLIGQITRIQEISFIGSLGMVVFLAFLAYLIVRYKAFHMKVIGVQALVITLIVLIGSTLLVEDPVYSEIIIAVTLLLVISLGSSLVRSVKREVLLRESLEVANKGQTNLIHIMNHQIKGYLSKSRNIFSELMTEPHYGPISENSKPMIEEGFKSLTEGVEFVQQILTSSSVQDGTYTYHMFPLDMKDLVSGEAEKLRHKAMEKNLNFQLNIEAGNHNLVGDSFELKEAIKNMIDNSIIYTKEGSVKVSLSAEKEGKIIFKVEDTGIGLSEEDKKVLFTKGGRGKDSIRVNVNSSGYGLAFVKGVVEAHRGRVWAESSGPGKGSQFYVELPVKQAEASIEKK